MCWKIYLILGSKINICYIIGIRIWLLTLIICIRYGIFDFRFSSHSLPYCGRVVTYNSQLYVLEETSGTVEKLCITQGHWQHSHLLRVNSNTGSDERQPATGGNALDHTALEVNKGILIELTHTALIKNV